MSIFKDFLNWLQSIGHDVLDFVTPLAKTIATSGGIVLAEAALAAVSAAETAGGSGQDKFNAAHKSIVQTLQDKGIPVVINAVNGAIEAAVAKMKG